MHEQAHIFCKEPQNIQMEDKVKEGPGDGEQWRSLQGLYRGGGGWQWGGFLETGYVLFFESFDLKKNIFLSSDLKLDTYLELF